MAKGTQAKKQIIDKIAKALGDDYIGECGNKHYIWAMENGEKIQIALTLTCPKTPVTVTEVPNEFGDGLDFSQPATLIPEQTSGYVEITEQEKETLAEMMARLGL